MFFKGFVHPRVSVILIVCMSHDRFINLLLCLNHQEF